jgi:ubiquinone/menaquinone biosynthesis C-methylase UbiE
MSVVWGSAPFENVAVELANIHQHLVGELGPKPGEQWLDVATGTGAVATLAARAGGTVTGLDFAPALIETAKRLAAEEGLDIHYDVGDAEDLPYENASFDVVSSSFGAIFAPDHAAVARELARVMRTSGRLGLTAWDPSGGVGDFFRLMAKYQPPIPDGAGSPLDWGREDYATQLLGGAFELRFVHADDPATGKADEMWEQTISSFGPMKTLYGSLDEAGQKELHDTYMSYMQRYTTDGQVEAPGEYLLVLGTRR